MRWDKGFSAEYIAMKVNPKTWEDEGEILITGGKIDRDIESASLNLRTLKPRKSWARCG